MKLLKKLVSKAIMEKPITKPKEETDLYTVFGVATGVRSGNTQYGDWDALMGNFEAVRTHDGEQFASSCVILPEPMNGMIVQQLNSGKADAVEFAVMVGLKPSDGSRPGGCGYEFTVMPLVEPTETDTLSGLRAKALGATKPKALASPGGSKKKK